MKFGIYVHSKRPKISPNEILKVVESAGVSYSNRDPDMAIVVGGDGTFGYYGKKLHIPVLFVGVNDNNVLGSKARLAELLFDDLHNALSEIKKGNYRLEKRTMFCVCIKQKNNDNKKERRIERATDILTDVYIERGIFSRCIRYALSVTMHKANLGYHTLKKFAEYAIGNGVIVSTSFGAYGYYSYLDRITVGKRNNNNKSNNGAQFSDNKLGICHIIPTFLVRKLSLGYKMKTLVRGSNIRYTVPNQSIIKISLTRNADVRLYGTTENSRGIAITSDDEILIGPSRRTAKIIRLDFDRTTR